MILKQQLRDILNKYKNQVDYIEVRVEDSRETKIDVQKTKVESISNNFLNGGNVRVLFQGGWGFVVFKNLTELESAIDKAIIQAKLVGKGTSQWAKVDPVEYISQIPFIKDPRDVSLQEKIRLLKDYTSLIDTFDSKIVSSQAVYNENFKHVIFANSEGSYIDQEYAYTHLKIIALAVADGNSENARIGIGTTNDFNVYYGLEDKIRENCQQALDLLNAPRIKGGKYTVLLNPDLAGVFVHEAFGHTMEADFIAGNSSMEETFKIGTTFGSKILNIYDSGIIPNLFGSYAYDNEGTPAEKTYLLKEGVLVGHLHNRETAAKMNEKPTGNARALSFHFPPIPRMRNTSIEAGSSTFEEMIKDIELGVYAINANGGKGGENFSFTAHHGFMIRNGKIAELIKGFTLAGNLFTTLKDIDMIGQDETFKNGPGGCGKGEQLPLPVVSAGPHIRIQNVTIGGDE